MKIAVEGCCHGELETGRIHGENREERRHQNRLVDMLRRFSSHTEQARLGVHVGAD